MQSGGKPNQSNNNNTIIFKELGRQNYLNTLAMMQEFTAKRNKETPDQIWFTEHNPVFSYGVSTDKNELPRATSIPVIAPDLKPIFNPAAKPFRDASAVLTLACTETNIPT